MVLQAQRQADAAVAATGAEKPSEAAGSLAAEYQRVGPEARMGYSWPSCVAEHQPACARSLSLWLSSDMSAPLQCTSVISAHAAAGQHEPRCMH